MHPLIFLLYYNNNNKYWNSLESLGICWNLTGIYFPLEFHGIWLEFQWIPMETVPGGSRIPTISTGFRRIPLEFLWNWKPEWLRLQPTSFHRNSMEFRHSTWNPPELMGDGKDLQGVPRLVLL